MIEGLKHLKDIISDPSSSWGTVTAKLISLLVLLFILDFSFNFTYNLHTSNKLSQLEKVTILKIQYENDSSKTREIERMESVIFNKEHYSEFIPRYLSYISFNQFIPAQNSDQISTDNKIINKPIFSSFWMVLTSNLLLAILLPFVVLLPIYDRSRRTGNGIAGWIASMVMLVGVMFLITWIAYQIPLIFNNPIWNYVLNFIIHMATWGLIFKLIGPKN